MKAEKAINNTFQIAEDFNFGKVKRTFYKPRKLKFRPRAEPHGKVKVFTEEEIFLFKVRSLNSSFNF